VGARVGVRVGVSGVGDPLSVGVAVAVTVGVAVRVAVDVQVGRRVTVGVALGVLVGVGDGIRKLMPGRSTGGSFTPRGSVPETSFTSFSLRESTGVSTRPKPRPAKTTARRRT
jgi:hypothetical protein